MSLALSHSCLRWAMAQLCMYERREVVFGPRLEGDPQDAEAKITQDATAKDIHPPESLRTDPASPPMNDECDAEAPQDGSHEESDEKQDECESVGAGRRHAAPQAGPEG